MGTYVQYGCGFCAPEGWLNYDTSPSLRIRKIPLIGKTLSKVPFPDAAMYGDIVLGLPLADGSVNAIYCSHTLEHLALEDCRLALKNTLRLLRSGGVFRFVLPDLKEMVMQYVSNTDPGAATQFVERTGLGRMSRPKGLGGMVRGWLGNSPHLWMWDHQSLSGELTNAGFVSIRKAEFGDSGDAMFDRVEEKSRWIDGVVANAVQSTVSVK